MLIHGASGGVGGFAVQIAKVKGAYVVATASGDGVKQVADFGADEVIDDKEQDFGDAGADFDLVTIWSARLPKSDPWRS